MDCTKYKEITPEEEQAEIIENKKQLDEFEEEFGDDFEEELEDLQIDTISIPIDTTGNN